jgi:hypothetical protein
MARIVSMLHRIAHYIPLLLIGLATGAEAQTTPVISLTMHYSHARDRMIEAGYQPFRVIPPDSDLFKRNFAGREDIARKFPEAAKCQSKGKSACYFLFARGPNEIVAITTVGAHAETLIVRKVSVATPAEAEGLYEK